MKLTELDLDRAQAWRRAPIYTAEGAARLSQKAIMNEINPTTRRFSRNLCQAFGPYTDSHIIETQPRSRLWTAVYAVVCFASFALVGFLLAARG